MSKVAVVGAGTMGNGIAHVFAQHGWEVTLVDVADDALARGLTTIKKNLERQVKKGALSTEQGAEAIARIKTSTSFDAVKTAELVEQTSSDDQDVFVGLGHS